jgi:hypothetical protein
MKTQVMKKLDRNGDGKVTREEFPGPADKFDEFDGNSDGEITVEEIPQDLVARAGRLNRRPVGGPATIKIASSSLLVYLGGTLYKLKVSDLELEGSLEVETPGKKVRTPDTERRRAKKREKGERGEGEGGSERPKKKDKDDDFGF